MNVNADLVGRYILRMAAEIEGLTLQRDALAQENQALRQQINVQGPAQPKAKPGPVLVTDPEGA